MAPNQAAISRADSSAANTVGLLAVSLLPSWMGLATWAYGGAAALLGAWFLWRAGCFLPAEGRDHSARKLFLTSIAYLPLALGAQGMPGADGGGNPLTVPEGVVPADVVRFVVRDATYAAGVLLLLENLKDAADGDHRLPPRRVDLLWGLPLRGGATDT